MVSNVLWYKRIHMKTVTFDFDDTIVMAHMLIENNKPIFVFDGYNHKILEKIR
jgi:hypothetical protein